MFGNWAQFILGKMRWFLPSERSDALLGPRGLRLDEWLSTGSARVVKQGPHRVVYRVELPGLSFYLKQNRLYDLRTWFRQWLRGSKARLEYQRACEVAERGVPTFEPIAVGEPRSRFGRRASFLLTRSLEDTTPLTAWIEQPLTPGSRQQLARELGILLAKMHHAGIRHHDLHAGNILVRPTETGVKLFLIDLNAVQSGPALTWKDSLDNLAMINRGFWIRATRTDRLRAWRAYWKTRQELGWADAPARRELAARETERRTVTSLRQFLASYDQRSWGPNRHFQKLHTDGVRGIAVAGVDVAGLLKDPDGPFRDATLPRLKDSRSSTVVEMPLTIAGETRPVIYKRFRVTSPLDPWINLLRRHPGLRSWFWGHALGHRGLPTPRPLLVIERRHHGMTHEVYLATEKVVDATDLAHFSRMPSACADMVPGSVMVALARSSRLNGVACAIARVMRQLHDVGLLNRDPKASNWLIDGMGKPWIIDLVGITQPRQISKNSRIRNLARLNASFLDCRHITRTTRLRFLRSYLRWHLVSKEGWKEWWTGVAIATEAKRRKNQRSGRTLA